MKSNEIEIPFGAKDSELIEATYYIPDGMEAIIEGDKVIIRKKESDDEKIRKSLIHLLQVGGYMSKEEKTKAFAWLEKQSKENMIEALQLEYEKGKADALQEQRKEWSEEDERIRKEIIYHIQHCDDTIDEVSEKRMIAWLEKQRYSEFELENEYWRGYDDAKFHLKEDKVTIIGAGSNSTSVSDGDNSITSKEVVSHPTITTSTTIEPKFKVGDWIVNNNSGCVDKVTEIRDDEYCLWPLDAEIEGYLRIIDVDNDYHLWTTQDAKDGDILASNKSIFIFQEEYIAEKPTAYCGLMNGLFIEGQNACWTNEKCYPATKEQCDLLFLKMKDAGYKWDAEKKELKKIDWSKDDERILTNLIDYFNIDDALLYPVEQIIDWFKSLKERIKNVKNR